MTDTRALSADDASVLAHLNLLQGVINRMASNSAACKAWCITIVSALIALIALKTSFHLCSLLLYPILLFFALDCYYLGLEIQFRNSYNAFVGRLHNSTLEPLDVFAIYPSGSTFLALGRAAKSFSIWSFYGLSIALSLVICFAVSKADAQADTPSHQQAGGSPPATPAP